MTVTTTTTTTLMPSICLLFSQLSSRHQLLILLPAILSSLLSSGIAPFMTYVISQAFNTFAQFPLTPNPPQSAKSTLLQNVGIAALKPLGLVFGSFALGSLTSSLWIWTGDTSTSQLVLWKHTSSFHILHTSPAR
jgi:ATP-binding cassette subfamily B (MDR/TAP) protein 1